MIGGVVSQKIFSGLSLKMNVTRLLQPVRGIIFQDLGQNKFILKFNHQLDRKLALGSPWLIDRCAMLLQPWDDTTHTEVNLMTIMVRLHNISHQLQMEKMVERVRAALDTFVERVTSKRDEFMDYIRIRVRIDVTRALKRGSYLHLCDGSKV